ncbi:MAG: NADP-dependent malic enzyme [bacterium]|nr:NADP-dependent malic enzyme [bacterium]
MDINEKAIKEHEKSHGKFSTRSKMPLKNKGDLSVAYTPGVAAVSSEIAKNPARVKTLTSKQNMVAIISDGSAVLGLGNIGPLAAIPVMEGKAAIFKTFANIDAVPIVLNTQEQDEIIKAVSWLAPSFGGINLEDIAAPKCFFIEQKLRKELDIPVFHDDQHGTAIVISAALTNALKVLGKKAEEITIVINGAGSAGIATAKMLLALRPKDIIMLDSTGIINNDRGNLNFAKKEMASLTNKNKKKGGLEEALKNANVFIGVSKGNILTPKHIKLMAKDPVIFAMANPIPEIMPDLAKKAGVKIIATGRSDFENQINNSLAFPGFFRGLLDGNIVHITEELELAAAKALAEAVPQPTVHKILPTMFEPGLANKIAKAVIKAKPFA